jgi:hypothetical protein
MSSPRDDAKSEDGDTVAQAKGSDDAPSSPTKPEVCLQPNRNICEVSLLICLLFFRGDIVMLGLMKKVGKRVWLDGCTVLQTIDGSNRQVSAHRLGNSWGTRKHTSSSKIELHHQRTSMVMGKNQRKTSASMKCSFAVGTGEHAVTHWHCLPS